MIRTTTQEFPIEPLSESGRSELASAELTLTPSLLWLFTVTAGVAVANLSYNQPLLPEIARTFAISDARAGAIATLTQAGYAAGLLFLVPLGDMVDRRRLVLATLLAVAVALVAVAAAPSFVLVAVASCIVGLTTIAPQLVIPFAASLAAPGARGRAVGHIMSGLLVGILGGRVLAGFVAQVASWRVMFALAAALVLSLAATLARWLPRVEPRGGMTYGALLGSLWPLIRTQPVLRESALLGALFFASFSALWTTLAFALKAPPLHYGSSVAGLFGLLGVAGALTAPIAGRYADRSSPRKTVAAAAGLNALSWITMLAAGRTLVGLGVGVLLLDASTAAAQVSNQSRIYSLPAHAHSRLNTVYMVAYFIGGSAGSIAGAAAWQFGQWTGVCAIGILSMSLAAAILLFFRPTER